MMASPCKIREAIKHGDRSLAFQLIESGENPFYYPPLLIFNDELTAFHEASGQGDLELLLTMAARPGTEWTKRYVVSRNTLVDAPLEGRQDLRTLHFSSGNFFHAASSISMEGVEVMMMYGYKFKQRDFERFCESVAADPSNLRVLQFCFSTGFYEKEECKLNRSLGLAIGGEHGCFFLGRNPTSLELANFLLKAGEDPNGYCFQGGTPYDFTPAIFQAIKNRDEDMVKLLLDYGADISKEAQFSRWTDERELDINCVSIETKASEMDMNDTLVAPDEPTKANPERCAAELRREFFTPMKPFIVDHSAGLIVAAMRLAGQPLPVGLATELIFLHCGPQGVKW